MTTVTLPDAPAVGERNLTVERGIDLVGSAEGTATGSVSRRGRSAASRLLRPLMSAGISLVVVLGLWLGFIYILNLNPLVAKSPIDVAKFFFNGGAQGQPTSAVWTALGQTVFDAGIGLVAGLVAAIAVALVFVTMRAIEQSFLPLAIVVRSVPLVAMTPLITLVCGRGLFGVTVITGLVVFFPALVTMTFGLRSASRQAADLCRAYGGGSWIIVRKVMLPSSLPAMFASARVAVPTSLIGALLAELLASGKGIGYAITQEENTFSYDTLWASVAVITLLSVLAYYAVQAVENVVLARFGPAPKAR